LRKFLPYFVTLVSEPQGCLPPKFHKIGNIKPLAVNSITASLPISSPPLYEKLQCTENSQNWITPLEKNNFASKNKLLFSLNEYQLPLLFQVSSDSSSPPRMISFLFSSISTSIR